MAKGFIYRFKDGLDILLKRRATTEKHILHSIISLSLSSLSLLLSSLLVEISMDILKSHMPLVHLKFDTVSNGAFFPLTSPNQKRKLVSSLRAMGWGYKLCKSKFSGLLALSMQ